jgi:DNA-binding NarL/FixJ family response regulator
VNQALCRTILSSDAVEQEFPMKTVVIIDDHQMFSDCLMIALSQEGFEVIGVLADGLSAAQDAISLRPDIVVLDINLPGMQGVDVAKEIRLKCPATRILFLTARDDQGAVRDAILAGANAFIHKSESLSGVKMALKQVESGGMYITPSLLGSMIIEWSRGTATPAYEILLTLRERQILKLVAEGHTTKEIATLLGISPKTVDGHRVRFMSKLDLHDLSSVVRFAVREDLIQV